LIQSTVWAWGAYVDLLGDGWLKSEEAKQPGIDAGTPAEWAVETHGQAQKVWKLLPSGQPLDDDYYNQVAPILDRQLGVAGLRLARFLNDTFSSNACPVP
jgi:nuclease S1